MPKRPRLPKPIVTYDLCTCDEEGCSRMPLRRAASVAEERRLRALLVRKAAA